MICNVCDNYLDSDKRIEKLEHSNQIMREALENISGQTMSMHICMGDMALRCREIASEALSSVNENIPQGFARVQAEEGEKK